MRKPGRPMSRRSPLIITASCLAATLSLALPTLDIELAAAEESVPAAPIADSDDPSPSARWGELDDGTAEGVTS
jgi:hypothetical protein